MASEVGICKLALAHLGDRANITAITPPDGSVQAAHCQTFYPMARDALLEMHNWRFATRRRALAVVDTDETPAQWAFTYQYPSCLKVVAVYPAFSNVTSDSRAIFNEAEFINTPPAYPFVIETLSDESQVIHTNVEDATVMYIAKVTDTTKFSPLFVLALARLLASYLAGPLIKGEPGMKVARGQLESFEKIEGMRAKASDSQAGKNDSYDKFIPAGLAARS